MVKSGAVPYAGAGVAGVADDGAAAGVEKKSSVPAAAAGGAGVDGILELVFVLVEGAGADVEDAPKTKPLDPAGAGAGVEAKKSKSPIISSG